MPCAISCARVNAKPASLALTMSWNSVILRVQAVAPAAIASRYSAASPFGPSAAADLVKVTPSIFDRTEPSICASARSTRVHSASSTVSSRPSRCGVAFAFSASGAALAAASGICSGSSSTMTLTSIRPFFTPPMQLKRNAAFGPPQGVRSMFSTCTRFSRVVIALPGLGSLPAGQRSNTLRPWWRSPAYSLLRSFSSLSAAMLGVSSSKLSSTLSAVTGVPFRLNCFSNPPLDSSVSNFSASRVASDSAASPTGAAAGAPGTPSRCSAVPVRACCVTCTSSWASSLRPAGCSGANSPLPNTMSRPTV